MNDFEKSLLNLLDECAQEPMVFEKVYEKVQTLPTFESCRKAFEKDVDFATAKKIAGFWGTFDAVIQGILHTCVRKKGKKIRFDRKLAIKITSKFRDELSASTVKYTANARLLGLKMTCKEIRLSEGLSLNRLNKKETENSIDHLKKHFSDIHKFLLSNQKVEIRMSICLPIDKSLDNAFFEAENNAARISNQKFRDVLNGLLLFKEGEIQLGPQVLKGGPIGGSGASLSSGFELTRIPNPNVIIWKKDISRLIKAVELVSDKFTDGDQVLFRALHRFLLGRNRRDLIDKFIDYVISWESLLLTTKGDQKDQELSYRFSINCASLLSIIKNDKDRKKYFKKMKSIYRLRSNIVHGGDDKNINKNITRGNFKDLKEVCEFLENNFRTSIWWLTSMDPNNRPYLKVDGWEDLLWS